MKIEHIAIWTNDIEKMKAFYEKYFGGVSNQKYINVKKRFESYFLTFEGGARIELMRTPDSGGKACAQSAGFAHLAFSAGGRENVIELTERLRKEGHTIHSGPRTTGDGYFESCIIDPEGNLVEITA